MSSIRKKASHRADHSFTRTGIPLKSRQHRHLQESRKQSWAAKSIKEPQIAGKLTLPDTSVYISVCFLCCRWTSGCHGKRRLMCLFSRLCWLPPTGAKGAATAVPAVCSPRRSAALISQEGRKWSSYAAANLRFMKGEGCKTKRKWSFLKQTQWRALSAAARRASSSWFRL